MKKYKISESKINEFWGWFGQKKPQTLQSVIDKDPVLKKLDKEIEDLRDKQIPILLRIKQNNPEDWKWMVEKGLVPANLK